MAKLVKCRNCEYQVARTANNCVQCHTKNPGLTTTDHFINTLCFAALLLGLMLLYKISFNDQLIQIADVEAAGFEKQYQRQTLIENAEGGWVGQWKSERIELYQFTDTVAVDLSLIHI